MLSEGSNLCESSAASSGSPFSAASLSSCLWSPAVLPYLVAALWSTLLWMRASTAYSSWVSPSEAAEAVAVEDPGGCTARGAVVTAAVEEVSGL